MQRVVAAGVVEAVISGPAPEQVVGPVPDQRIAADGPCDGLEPLDGGEGQEGSREIPGEFVPQRHEDPQQAARKRREIQRIEALAPPIGQREWHQRFGRHDGVVVGAAVEGFGSDPGRKDEVVAVIAKEHGLARLRDHRVVAGTAVNRRGLSDPAHNAVVVGAAVEDAHGNVPADQRVVPRAPVQRLDHRAAVAVDQIVAQTPEKRIVARAAGQRVIATRADDAFDLVKFVVARGIARGAAAGALGLQVDVDGGHEGRIVHQIRAIATKVAVGPRPGDEGVVIVAADDDIIPGTVGNPVVAIVPAQVIIARGARQRVVALRRFQFLDAADGIVRSLVAGTTARGAARRKVDIDADRRMGIAQPVRAVAAIKRVRAAAGLEIIMRQPAIEGVVPLAPEQLVRPILAAQDVVAVATLEVVPPGVAGQGVIAARADQMLESVDRVIARGIPRGTSGGAVGGQVHVDRGGIGAVIEQVPGAGVVAAVEGIRPRADHERVAAPTAIDGVIPGAVQQQVVIKVAGQQVVSVAPVQHTKAGTARQRVVAAGADDTFEPVDRVIARGIPRGTAGRAVGGQVHVDRGGKGAVIQHIQPPGVVKPVEEIGPRAHDERVRSVQAVHRVVAGAIGQHVASVVADDMIVMCRADDVVDIVEGVALRDAQHATGDQTDGHAAAGRGVGDRVDTATAKERIGPAAPVERVVPIAAVQRVRATPTEQPVRVVSTIQHVQPRSAVEPVVAAAAKESIVGAGTVQPVGAVIPGQVVRLGRADQIFDPDQDITRGVAARGASGQQVDRDPGRRPLVTRRIVADAAI